MERAPGHGRFHLNHLCPNAFRAHHPFTTVLSLVGFSSALRSGESMRTTRHVHVSPTKPKLSASLREAGPRDAFCDELSVSGVRYCGADAGFDGAYAMTVSGCSFDGVRLAGEIGRTGFDNCIFDLSDLSNVRADETSFIESVLRQSRLTGLSLTNGVARDVVVEDTRADLSVFRYTKFRTVVFAGCNLAGVDFQRATFRNVRFERCDLTGAQFGHAVIDHNTSFVDCRLVDIGGVKGLKGARVRGDDLLGLAGSLAREVGIDVEW